MSQKRLCASASTYLETKEPQMSCQAEDTVRTSSLNMKPEAWGEMYRKRPTHQDSSVLYIILVFTHICVCMCESDWAALNSAKTARQLYISWKAKTCQSRQRRLWWSHNFFLSNVREIKWFSGHFFNASTTYPLKKRCQRNEGKHKFGMTMFNFGQQTWGENKILHHHCRVRQLQ